MPRPERIRPPQQERSRETLDRIVAAAEHLLDGRPFDDISIDEIVNEADVSRSSFYARFPSKESLLPLLFERYTERAKAAFDIAAGVDVTTIDTRELVEHLIRAYFGFLRRFQRSTTTFDLAGSDIPRDRLQDDVVAGVVVVYLRAIGRDGDEVMARRVEFATRSAGAVLLRAVGPQLPFADAMGMGDDELVLEVTAMMTAYLADAERRLDS